MNDQLSASTESTKQKEECTIEDLARAIEAAEPPPKRVSAAEKVRALKKQIQDAQKRGHNAASIHDIFLSKGEKISTRLIANLLSKPRAKGAQAA